jgi:hypothetical protein
LSRQKCGSERALSSSPGRRFKRRRSCLSLLND